MRLNEIDYDEYIHLFEINKIKQALFLSIVEHNNLIKNRKLNNAQLRRINILLNEFKRCCFKIIKRDINTVEEYVLCSKALILIIGEIRTIIRKQKNVKDNFGRVFRLLPLSESSFQSFFAGHSTNIILFVTYFSLIVILILYSYIFTHTQSLTVFILFLIVASMLVIFLVLQLVFRKRFENNVYLDKIKRIMDKNIYLNKSIDSEKVLDTVEKVKRLITK